MISSLNYRLSRHFLLLAVILVSWRCAAVKAPSGGPKDEAPPLLVTATPPSGTVNITGGLVVSLEFSEYIDENSITNCFHLSPLSSTPLDLDYRDRVINVTFPDSLVTDQTYVLTISRDLRDEHGVTLAEPLQLAYSTGNRIENRMISGKIYYNDVPAALHLWDLGLTPATDSLFASLPLYLTDAADDGSFEFRFLRPSRYRILAVDRSAAGVGLNTARSGYAVARQHQIDLDRDSIVTAIDLPFHREPAQLRFLRGEWTGRRWGRLFFNNPLRQEPAAMKLELTDGSGSLPAQYFLDPLDSSAIIIISSADPATDRITLLAGATQDVFRQSVDSVAVTLRVAAKPDTASPTILAPIKDLKLDPESGPIRLVISKPVVDWTAAAAIRLLVSDSLTVPIAVDSISPLHLSLTPLAGWQAQTNYRLEIPLDSIICLDGTSPKDSLFVTKISVGKQRGRGAVGGSVTGLESPALAALGPLEKSVWNHLSDVNSESTFYFENIPEGYHRLMIFNDENGNRRFDFGQAYPFIPSEWFYLSSDTVEVRANWDIRLPDINLMEVER
ncbi:MAG: Ig-like domain-containing protein [Candidatus Neomarinimicrobiota bacterium]